MNTPTFRVSYPTVFAPEKNALNGDMEYSLVAIFPVGTDLSDMKLAAKTAAEKKWGLDPSKWPLNLKKPFRPCKERWKFVDGKQIVPAGYEDGEAMFATFKQKADKGQPQIVDREVNPIRESQYFYAGCHAIASVRAYAYDNMGNKGVAFGLGNVQKVDDGVPLGGGRTLATNDFSPVGEAMGKESAESLFS